MTRTVFKKYKFRKNTDLHVEILVQEYLPEIMRDISN